MHQSGRNSGVLHSGVYYPAESLKAQLTREGYRRLLDYCLEHRLPVELCGKAILAANEEDIPRLEALQQRGHQNGLKAQLIDQKELAAHEPHTRAAAALWVPETGIVDFKAVARRYAKDVKGRGGELILDARVSDFSKRHGHLDVVSTRGEFSAGFVVNCGGLFSDRIARLAGLDPNLRIVPFRGEYFELKPDARRLVRGLIYPLADPKFPFLGVHLTRTIGGEVLAGPNAVLSYRREGYSTPAFSFRDSLDTLTFPGFWRLAVRNLGAGLNEMLRSWSAAAFVRELQKLVPEIRAEHLTPARAGIRAQAVDQAGRLVDDFVFARGERSLHVLNAPSPAATASLAIGEYIATETLQQLGP
jgi:L-2-hydroxyglutarate oxidase